MKQQLYNGALWEAFARVSLERSITEVQALSRQAIASAEMHGALQEIIDKDDITIPQLSPDQIWGDNRQEHEARRDARGLEASPAWTSLDVNIPFSGDIAGFVYQPSRCNVIDDRVEIKPDRLVLTLREDDLTQSTVDSFVRRVTENLINLRNEVQQSRRFRDAQLRAVVTNRQAEIRDAESRRPKLNFPVRD